ncbi:hypothetical protein PPACK8108_LOCUS4161 [Phakopsora pachyrhizi]|uniref:Uncharacterized protein n=1 Tax=Phakopsora pachyrhizi TaxID=170000 RepID=A0AAV0ALX3_PHAPC|nr:hypothetical protein PPACK8108_LOCUS4161 [Phakopsora pachyrhizi]
MDSTVRLLDRVVTENLSRKRFEEIILDDCETGQRIGQTDEIRFNIQGDG